MERIYIFCANPKYPQFWKLFRLLSPQGEEAANDGAEAWECGCCTVREVEGVQGLRFRVTGLGCKV